MYRSIVTRLTQVFSILVLYHNVQFYINLTYFKIYSLECD